MSKSLEELKHELAEKRAKMQCSSGCEHTDKVWQRHLKIGFEDGFDAAIKAVSEREKKLIETLETSILYQEKAKSFISHYDDCNALIDEEYEGACECGMDTFAHDNYIAICLGKEALKDYRVMK